jgi:uncharacterized protein YwgA
MLFWRTADVRIILKGWRREMDRLRVILVGLGASDGAVHTPVQIQKLLFIVDKKASRYLSGPHFSFVPHYYGPFDRQIYSDLENLEEQGLVDVVSDRSVSWKKYRLTRFGQIEADKVLEEIDPAVRQFLESASAFVRKLSFAQLVSAVYKAYPEMKVNSVFH